MLPRLKPVRRFSALKLRMNSLQTGEILFRHLFRERALGGLQFRFQHDHAPVPRKRVEEARLRLVWRRIGPCKPVAPEGRTGLKPPCNLRQIPALQMALQPLPFKRRMEGRYIYDFIA